jgi:hypothetical protein
MSKRRERTLTGDTVVSTVSKLSERRPGIKNIKRLGVTVVTYQRINSGKN